MFRIKICGVRLKSDVQAVKDAGADAIGLNFFPPSIRSLSPSEPGTKDLSDFAAELELCRVGVFVNEPVEDVLRIADSIGLDVIQLHGDEQVSETASLQRCGLGLLRAIKLPTDEQSVAAIEKVCDGWVQAGFRLLFDADAGRLHGGGGKTLHWPSIRRWAAEHPTTEWTLAGGLKPENIADAIRETDAVSVDTASGVESPKGRKNAERIMSFVKNAQFDQAGQG